MELWLDAREPGDAWKDLRTSADRVMFSGSEQGDEICRGNDAK